MKTLIVGMDGAVSHEQVDYVRDRLREAMPDVEVVVLAGITSLAMHVADTMPPLPEPSDPPELGVISDAVAAAAAVIDPPAQLP